MVLPSPERYTNVNESRPAFNDLVDRFPVYFTRLDPLADDLVEIFTKMPPGKGIQMLNDALDNGIEHLESPPEELVRFMAHLDHVPLWVDRDKIKRGGGTYLRSGLLGALALFCYSLPYGYLSPDASQPLVFSGRLVQRAYRRLIETSRYVFEVCKPGGLDRYSTGFKVSVRVRLMHSQVRRLLLKSGKWDSEKWGAPINQADLLATNMLFSIIVLDAMRKFGFFISNKESEDVMHHWKYAGYLMGVDQEILMTTESEGWRTMDLIMATKKKADVDSCTLNDALMDAGAEAARLVTGIQRTGWVSQMLRGVSSSLVGEKFARELKYPRSLWSFTIVIIKMMVRPLEVLRKSIPGSNPFAVRVGTRMWRFALAAGLQGQPATFKMPDKLKSKKVETK